MTLSISEQKAFDALKTELPEFLAKAEAAYGTRNTDWQIADLEHGPDGPRIKYEQDPSNTLTVVISTASLEYIDQARHQLAHEVFHILSPKKRNPAPLIEEGAAVNFSIEAPDFSNPDYRAAAEAYYRDNAEAIIYETALKVVKKLLEIDQDAILKLRSIRECFDDITVDDIKRVTNAPDALARLLTIAI